MMGSLRFYASFPVKVSVRSQTYEFEHTVLPTNREHQLGNWGKGQTGPDSDLDSYTFDASVNHGSGIFSGHTTKTPATPGSLRLARTMLDHRFLFLLPHDHSRVDPSYFEPFVVIFPVPALLCESPSICDADLLPTRKPVDGGNSILATWQTSLTAVRRRIGCRITLRDGSGVLRSPTSLRSVSKAGSALKSFGPCPNGHH